jgi:hypothetical protein
MNNLDEMMSIIRAQVDDVARQMEEHKAVVLDLIAERDALRAALLAVLPPGWIDDDTMDHMPGIKQARAALKMGVP